MSKNSNDIKISIPKPCHEDWNQMTPNEKGSFCDKCCKTVIDFTNKSAEEIKNTLLAENGKKVCGRFMSDQLDEKPKPVFNLNIPLYLLPKNISHRKSFAIALFFAFGTSLFSCRTTEDHIVGDIAIVETNLDTTIVSKQNQIDTTKEIIILQGEPKYKNPNEIITGGVSAKPICKPIQGDVDLKKTAGEVIIETDTIKNEPKMGKIKVYKGIDE